MTTTTLRTADAGASESDLFEPASIAGLDLPNRFAMAPMTRGQSPGGVPDENVAEYYRRRAQGGVGLVITEGILVDHRSAGAEDDVPRLSPAASLAGWRHVVGSIHGTGARVVAQLWHQGSERSPVDGFGPWTPSGVREDGSAIGHAMTPADIDILIAAYADAGLAAQHAGFDGVEVHAAHGYLLDEFLWPATNRRTDRYGGGVRGRSRLVAQIVSAIRAATGSDFPISVRFSQFKERDFDATIAANPRELGGLLEPMVDAGATLLHASARRIWEPAFAGSPRTLAGWARDLTGLPTIAVGSVGLRAQDLHAEDGGGLQSLARLRASGDLDVVAVGRALLGNPRWVEHARDGAAGDLVDYDKSHELIYP